MDALKNNPDVLTLDPLAMGIEHRVGPGGRLEGLLEFDEGLLVQGSLAGEIIVRGHLIIWDDGLVKGRVVVHGNTYVFGRIGETFESSEHARLECHGRVCIANGAISTGSIHAASVMLYHGADLRGPVSTFKQDPRLHQQQLDASDEEPIEQPREAQDRVEIHDELDQLFSRGRPRTPVFSR